MTPAAVLQQAMVTADIDRRGAADLAASLGMEKVIGARAACGRPIAAGHHLRLCLALGVDPYGGAPVPKVAAPGALDIKLLALGVRAWRYQKIDNRTAARQAGISVRALSWIENARPVSIETVLTVCRAVGVHPFHYVGPTPGFTGNMRCNTLKSQEQQEKGGS